MRSNFNFASFQIGNNNFMDDGLFKFCDVLDETKHIIALDVSMNKITSIGAERLAQTLLVN